MATYTTPERSTNNATGIDNSRKDRYWISSAATIITFTVFVIYSTIRAFMGKFFSTYYDGHHFTWLASTLTSPGAIRPHYWSPFYSPYLGSILHYHIGNWPISASLYVLIFPLSFRLSCYYCRRAYYRAVFQDPGACAVKELFARRGYSGETKMPSKLFNFHRYALYAAIILVIFHWWHLYNAFFYTQNGSTHFGAGLGTLIFLVDTLALTAYTFSCHSFRHLIGGVINRFSTSRTRHGLWTRVTAMNNWHAQFFWISLTTVLTADLYVYLVSSGAVTDIRFF